MIRFEEELAKFRPSTEVDQAEEKIRLETVDMTDLMMEILKENEPVSGLQDTIETLIDGAIGLFTGKK